MTDDGTNRILNLIGGAIGAASAIGTMVVAKLLGADDVVTVISGITAGAVVLDVLFSTILNPIKT